MISIPLAEGKGAPNLLPATLVLSLLLWIFTTTGGQQILVNEMLSEAYDSQAEHFLRGDVGVDGGAIRHEAMIVNGKARMYFGRESGAGQLQTLRPGRPLEFVPVTYC
jgi:hypothetical protein